MPRRKASAINPGNVGQIFLKPGEKVPYVLSSCEVEPNAKMLRCGSIDDTFTAPVSELKDWVWLRPVGKIQKKQEPSFKERKPRRDKGTKRVNTLAVLAEAEHLTDALGSIVMAAHNKTILDKLTEETK